jgi:hypothetical protein
MTPDPQLSARPAEAYGLIGPAERGRNTTRGSAWAAVILTIVVPAWCIVAAVAILWRFW